MTVTFCVNTTIDEGVDNKGVDDKNVDVIVDENKKNKEIIDVEEFSDEFSDSLFSTLLQQIIFAPIGDRKGENDKTEKLLEKLFKKAYEDNDVVKEIMDAKARGLRKLPTVLTKKDVVLSMGDLKIKNRQLYVKNRMYVPENKPLQLFLLQQRQDLLIHGYSKYKVMY